MVMAPLIAGAVTSGLKKGKIPLIGKKKKGTGMRRRRRARLTQSELLELTNIKNILGRTAAANALPFYLGRGR